MATVFLGKLAYYNSIAWSDITGKPGVSNSGIEFYPGDSSNNGGYIDFHYNNDSADYTTRILSKDDGYIQMLSKAGLSMVLELKSPKSTGSIVLRADDEGGNVRFNNVDGTVFYEVDTSNGLFRIYSYKTASTSTGYANLLWNRLDGGLTLRGGDNPNYANAPSADRNSGIITFQDTGTNVRFRLYSNLKTDGGYSTYIMTGNTSSDGAYNQLRIGLDSNSEPVYGVSSAIYGSDGQVSTNNSTLAQTRFRDAIGASSGIWPISMGGTGNSNNTSYGVTQIISTLDFSKTNFDISELYDKNMCWFGDKSRNGIGRINFQAKTDGTTQTSIQTRCWDTSGNAFGGFLGISLIGRRDNTVSYIVHNPDNFRSAISAVNKTGDTMTGTLNINNGSGNGITLWKGSEGGNIRIYGADGTSYYEFDGYDSTSFRIVSSNTNNTTAHSFIRWIDNDTTATQQLYGTSQGYIQHMRKVNNSTYHLSSFIVFNSDGAFSFYEYPTDNTTGASTNREYYMLPAPTAGRTASIGFNILTSKNTVTVGQGGTGATTFTPGAALIGAGTGAVTTRSITNNTTAGSNPTANTNLITANTLINYKGTSNINTVGEITTGTWNAGQLQTTGYIYLKSTATASDITNRAIVGGATNQSTWNSSDGTYTYVGYPGSWNYIYLQNRYKRTKNADNTVEQYQPRIWFRSYGTTTETGSTRSDYYEAFYLPMVNAGRTSNGTYSILTTKNAVEVSQGGTGKTSWTQWGVLYASASTTLANTGAGTAGYQLTSNATSAPTWNRPTVGQDVTTTTSWRKILVSYNTYAAYDTDVTNATGMAYQVKAISVQPSTGSIKASKVYNAVWNDYAEFRKTNKDAKFGQCVIDNDDGSLSITTERLMPGAQVVSDTWGTSMGETDEAQTPVAVAGRVLVYPYQNRSNYHAGMAVCSAPNGTVDIMTREEIMMYPDCIIGIVSEIPEYETWGTGNVEVNGRIWIKIK